MVLFYAWSNLYTIQNWLAFAIYVSVGSYGIGVKIKCVGKKKKFYVYHSNTEAIATWKKIMTFKIPSGKVPNHSNSILH